MQLSLKASEPNSSYLARANEAGNAATKSGKEAIAGRPLLARTAAIVPAAVLGVTGGVVGLVASPIYAVEKVASKSFVRGLIDFVGNAAFGAVALGGIAALANTVAGVGLPILTLVQGAGIAAGALGLAVVGGAAIDSISAYGSYAAGKTLSFVANGFDRLGIGAKKPQA